MLFRAELVAALILPVGIGLSLQGADDPTSPASTPTVEHAEVSFAEEVMPLFDEYCVRCHGNQSAELGLNLETYEGAMAGSDYGTVIEPGNVAGSLLVDMIESGDMPEDGDPMPAEALAVIKTWIEEGAQNN